MPGIELADRFKKKFADLLEPIQGAPGIYDTRVDWLYRLPYERLPEDVLRLRVVG